MKKLLWLSCLSYLIIGLAHVVGGSVLWQVMEKYSLTYKDGGQWLMNQFLGFLIGVLLAPFITSRLGKRGAVLVAIGVLTISEAAYSLLPPWGLMLTIAPFAGFGFGMTEAVIGAMIIDIAADNGKASAMSRLEIFFGVGAFLMPILAGLLIRLDVWQLSFPILSAMAGIAFILWFTVSFGKIDDQIGYHARSGLKKANEVSALQRAGSTGWFGYQRAAVPFLLLSALFFMVYVGLEMSFANYLPSLFIERSQLDMTTATAVLSLFWATMIIGRLFAGQLADRIGYSRYLLIAMAGGSIIFLLLALIGTLSWAIALVALSGLFLSGVFGIALVYANQLIPGMTERTTSLLVAFGGLGGALFPRLTGWMMDDYGANQTLWMISILIFVLLALLIMMLVLGRRQSHREGMSEAS